MPHLSLDIPHVLSPDEAVTRLKNKFAAARAEYQSNVSDFKEEWRDHTFSYAFKVLGMAVSGTIAVEEKWVHLATELPMAAMFFKAAIEDRIRKEVGALLGAKSPLPPGEG